MSDTTLQFRNGSTVVFAGAGDPYTGRTDAGYQVEASPSEATGELIVEDPWCGQVSIRVAPDRHRTVEVWSSPEDPHYAFGFRIPLSRFLAMLGITPEVHAEAWFNWTYSMGPQLLDEGYYDENPPRTYAPAGYRHDAPEPEFWATSDPWPKEPASEPSAPPGAQP